MLTGIIYPQHFCCSCQTDGTSPEAHYLAKYTPLSRLLLQKIKAVIDTDIHTIRISHYFLAIPGARDICDSVHVRTFYLKNAPVVQAKEIISNLTKIPDLTTGLGDGMDIRQITVQPHRIRGIIKTTISSQIQIAVFHSSRITCTIRIRIRI